MGLNTSPDTLDVEKIWSEGSVLVMSGPVSRPHEGHYVMLAILEPYCLLVCLLGSYVSDRPQVHHVIALCPFAR